MPSNTEKAASAKALSDRGRHYDRLHHRKRLAWLSGPSPLWADGTPLTGHEQIYLTEGSRSAINMIELHGMSDNSVDITDHVYLAELDAYEAASNTMKAAA